MADGSVIIDVGIEYSQAIEALNMIESAVSSLGSNLESMELSGMESAFAFAFANVNTMAGEMGSELVMLVSQTMADISDAFLSHDWNSIGKSISDSISAGFGSGADIASKAREAANSIRGAFNDNWYSIGASIMSGIASGIRAAGDEVVAAIREVSAETKQAAEEYYDIHSPSRVMRDEVGVMISRGIAEGIIDGGRYIREALDMSLKEANKSADIIKEESGGYVGKGNYTQNIYLSADVKSPYAVSRAIRRESEAMLRVR